jgi:hypothetical protein
MLSDRGEVVAVVDRKGDAGDVSADEWGVAFAEPGAIVPAGQIPGSDVAISGDGCVGAVTIHGDEPRTELYAGLCESTPPQSRVLVETGRLILSNPALSHDGRFLAAEARVGNDLVIVRIDTTSHEPVHGPDDERVEVWPGPHDPEWIPEGRLGIDISDDGDRVVSTFWEFAFIEADPRDDWNEDDTMGGLFVAAWDVSDDVVTIVSGDASSGFPSMSGDGTSVSYASFEPPAALEQPPPAAALAPVEPLGPWIYVRQIGELVPNAAPAVHELSDPVQISEDHESATYTSLSRDGTQIAFAVVPASCEDEVGEILLLGASRCRPNQIEVAYGSQPVFGDPFERETIVAVEGGATDQPVLSGTGRVIAWRSDAGHELVGDGKLEGLQHVFMRTRRAEFVVEDIAFGEVARDDWATASAMVRNTGTTTVSIDQAASLSEAFVVVPGGTCDVGTTTLPPGGSCTIGVRFDSHGRNDHVTGSLEVREEGYDALSATGALSADVAPLSSSAVPSTAPEPSPPSVPDAPDVPDAIEPPRQTTDAPTAAPTTFSMLASPSPVDFGVVMVGTPSDVSVITVEITGDRPGAPVAAVRGLHGDDFTVVNDTCSSRELLPGASCTIEVIATAVAGGPRSAVLALNSGGTIVEVELRAEAHYLPRLVASPMSVTERGVTMIVGQGFPPLEPVVVHVGNQSTSLDLIAHPDELGRVRLPLRPLGALQLGNYIVSVEDRPAFYDGPSTTLLVVLSTFEPSGGSGPHFKPGVLVSRGQ